jgi:hypothetical protein
MNPGELLAFESEFRVGILGRGDEFVLLPGTAQWRTPWRPPPQKNSMHFGALGVARGHRALGPERSKGY